MTDPGIAKKAPPFVARAAAAAVRPAAHLASSGVHAGLGVQRRAVDRLLDSGELERRLGAVLDSRRSKAAITAALESQAAKDIVGAFFASSLFDEIVSRLLESPQLWQIIEEVADSPSVTAAISQQGVGFADVVATEVRSRSRQADTWLERVASKVSRSRERPAPGRAGSCALKARGER